MPLCRMNVSALRYARMLQAEQDALFQVIMCLSKYISL